MGPRQVAVRILLRRFRESVVLDRLFLEKEFTALCTRDRRLATELVYGCLRNLSRIDYTIQQLSERPLTRIQDEVLWILRLAIYEADSLRIPPYASVNQAVETSRRMGRPRAARFINGILRSYQRRPPEPPQGDEPAHLAIRYSHPEWLVRRYLKRYGPIRARRIMDQNNQVPEPYLWVNLHKITVQQFCGRLASDGIECQTPLALPGCVLVQDRRIRDHELYKQGYCFFMDPGSQNVAGMVVLSNKKWVADICAAPGNKSFVMAVRTTADSLFLCGDSSPERLAVTRQRAEHYGIEKLSFVLLDAEKGLPFSDFDAILCDVPCSGLGTIRSNPDIRWTFEEKVLTEFRDRQTAILSAAINALRPGGEVLYATCSTEPEENEQVVEAVLKARPSVSRIGQVLNTFEESHPGEGFFAARLRKNAEIVGTEKAEN